MAEPAVLAGQAQVSSPSPSNPVYARPIGDMTIVIGLTLLVAFLAWHFEFSETIFHWTRTREHYQLDELPVVALSFSLLLLWFARRRFREARSALHKRDMAERQLEHLLEENRRLARQTIGVQEAERRNLARELHDEMGQYLNAIKIDVVSLQRCPGQPGGPAQESLDAIVRNVNHVYWVINDMIRRLRPVGLDELGLAAALENCVDGWRTRLPATSFELTIDGDVSEFDEQLNLTIYRMVQEGLTNVAKHAGATKVGIRLAHDRDRAGREYIVFSMDDNGCGAAAADASGRTGLGLIGMRERVQALGGELTVPDVPHGERGFRFSVRIPAQKG